MKTKILFSLVAGMSFIFSACDEFDCEICTKASEPEVRICEEDYDSKTEYGLAVDAKEAQGYNCK